jgi:hypothetical protein
MRKAEPIDFTKLLGFETVTRELSEALDFQDERPEARGEGRRHY